MRNDRDQLYQLGKLAAQDKLEQLRLQELNKDGTTTRCQAFDVVNNPTHYSQGRRHEPIDVIEDWQLNYRLGNVVKYVSRAGRKTENSLEDLKKAAWYLAREIASVEKGELK